MIESGDLIARITSTDPEEVMPPPKDHAPLKSTEVTTLKQWIVEGAKYEAHWAFVPPKSETKTSIDAIVRQQLQAHVLKPSPPADDATLRRRVSLALTGLPSHEVQKSYSELVDALLASPHFGERLSLDWLDAARYADTNGFEKDLPRSIWPYRDWVIKALNADLPFDQFVVQQIAADRLGSDRDAVAALGRLDEGKVHPVRAGRRPVDPGLEP